MKSAYYVSAINASRDRPVCLKWCSSQHKSKSKAHLGTSSCVPVKLLSITQQQHKPVTAASELRFRDFSQNAKRGFSFLDFLGF